MARAWLITEGNSRPSAQEGAARRFRRGMVLSAVALFFASSATASNDVPTALKIVQICRESVDGTKNVDAAFLDAGFEHPKHGSLAAAASIMSYASRLSRAERNPTYRPDPAEFPAQYQRNLDLTVRLKTLSTGSVFVRAAAPRFVVNVTRVPFWNCGFTYNGPFLGWAALLGYDENNSAHLHLPIEYSNYSLVRGARWSPEDPSLGTLEIIAQTLAPADFGGDLPVVTWSLSK